MLSERAGLLIKARSRTFPQVDPLLLRTDMSNPDDDTDVPSGLNDDAEMERTSPRASQMVISSPAPGRLLALALATAPAARVVAA